MEKATKAVADYSLHGNEPRHCGICTMFRKPDKCTAVKGWVNADIGICKFFEKRK